MRMRSILWALMLLSVGTTYGKSPAASLRPTPVILITDLYCPGQDVGDNFDLLTPYALQQIDLRGVILDITERFLFEADGSRREPGYVPIAQLNYLFGREVPCACAPFKPMQRSDDTMEAIPAPQQAGLSLFFRLLRESKRPVEVVSTGSCRLLAVAYNRNPKLMRRKISRIHLCAGAISSQFREWNIELDTLAANRLLTSNLKIYLYPCATSEGPFDKGANNTFWSLNDLSFIMRMQPELRNYLTYAFLRKNGLLFIHYLTDSLSTADEAQMKAYRIDRWYGSGGCHYVWETPVWQQVAHMDLVLGADKGWHLVARNGKNPLPNHFDESMVPVQLSVKPDGRFDFRAVRKSHIWIYRRDNPDLHQSALRQALPELYEHYRTTNQN